MQIWSTEIKEVEKLYESFKRPVSRERLQKQKALTIKHYQGFFVSCNLSIAGTFQGFNTKIFLYRVTHSTEKVRIQLINSLRLRRLLNCLLCHSSPDPPDDFPDKI